jgi:hypothetical protein
MNEMQDKLFNSLLEYWQLIIDKLKKELTIAYSGSSGNTRQEITIANVNPISKTNSGYKVSLFMPDYYEFLDEGVSGAKFNTSISRFKYRDKGKGKGGRGQKGIPPTAAIRKFMKNRAITTPRTKNTKAGKKRDTEAVLQGIAFAIAYSIWSRGLEPSNFYSNVINDKELLAFEQKLIDEYGDFILDVVRV